VKSLQPLAPGVRARRRLEPDAKNGLSIPRREGKSFAAGRGREREKQLAEKKQPKQFSAPQNLGAAKAAESKA
jgi:hypothetical protein